MRSALHTGQSKPQNVHAAGPECERKRIMAHLMVLPGMGLATIVCYSQLQLLGLPWVLIMPCRYGMACVCVLFLFDSPLHAVCFKV